MASNSNELKFAPLVGNKMLFFDVGFNNYWQGIKNSCKYGCVLGVSY
jgi:hypothetical protein